VSRLQLQLQLAGIYSLIICSYFFSYPSWYKYIHLQKATQCFVRVVVNLPVVNLPSYCCYMAVPCFYGLDDQ